MCRIFVDGRPYLGDRAQYLHTLHGSDLERIEIITNPSAQYSAEGTGGIINFVLRKKQGDGASGNVGAEFVTPRAGRADASAKIKNGKWTLELAGAAETGRTRSNYRKLRSVEQSIDGSATINTESGGGPTDSTSGYGSGKLTYDIDPKTRISLNVIGIGYRSRSQNRAEFAAVTPNFIPFSERQLYASSGSYMIGEFAFDHKGLKEGETLTATFTTSSNPRQPETDTAEFSTGGSLFTERVKAFEEQKGQVDWQHPLKNGQILSLGGTWDRTRMNERYRFTSDDTGGLSAFVAADRFAGVDDKLMAYTTFQQPIGSWTVMPGVRIERDNRRIASPAHPDVRVNRADLFPTLHINHALSKALTLTFSYSKRIDRPQLNELRPYAIVQDVLNAKQGNPYLRNQATNAFEANLHYHRGKLDAGLLLYDRETHRVWSTAYTVVNGINVSRQVNAGHSRSSGAEIDLSMPIVARLKVSGTVNLFDQRIPVDAVSGS